MADADVVREVTQHVEDAIRENRRIETVLMFMLVTLFIVGVGLMIFGAILRQGLVILPGSICELAIAWPIWSLVKLRQENIRLAILPQLMRMADGKDEKRLTMKFIETLIKQIGS